MRSVQASAGVCNEAPQLDSGARESVAVFRARSHRGSLDCAVRSQLARIRFKEVGWTPWSFGAAAGALTFPRKHCTLLPRARAAQRVCSRGFLIVALSRSARGLIRETALRGRDRRAQDGTARVVCRPRCKCSRGKIGTSPRRSMDPRRRLRSEYNGASAREAPANQSANVRHSASPGVSRGAETALRIAVAQGSGSSHRGCLPRYQRQMSQRSGASLGGISTQRLHALC